MVSRSHTVTDQARSPFVKSVATKSPPSFSFANSHSSVSSVRSPRTSKLTFDSRDLPFLLCRKPRRPTSSASSRTPTCAPFTPNASPSCQEISSSQDVSAARDRKRVSLFLLLWALCSHKDHATKQKSKNQKKIGVFQHHSLQKEKERSVVIVILVQFAFFIIIFSLQISTNYSPRNLIHCLCPPRLFLLSFCGNCFFFPFVPSLFFFFFFFFFFSFFVVSSDVVGGE